MPKVFAAIFATVALIGNPAGLLAETVDPAPAPEVLIYEAEPEGQFHTCSGCDVCRPGRFWVRGEYLLWWTDGLRTPPLVTTSPQGTAQADAGTLPDATILFGGDLLTDSRSGGRIRFGGWLDDCGTCGWEAEYLGLSDISEHYSATSSGDPILARPFQNALTNAEDSELVAFDPIVAGTIAVDADGEFQSAGVRYLCNICCQSSEDCCELNMSRLDLLVGYRFLRLRESLRIREDLQALPLGSGTFEIEDRFDTRNQFHGAEIGLTRTERRGRTSLEVLAKVAFGNVHQTVSIDGSTVSDDGTGPQQFTGGLLAQRTNSGVFTRDRFALVPELGLTLLHEFSPRLQGTFGYSLIYLDRAVRAGDQIDTTLNPNLLPPEVVPFSGPLRPAFAFREDSFWAQGLSVGLNFVW